nr:MAG TPA: hypothetical protein [Caudoviricetes sp.]
MIRLKRKIIVSHSLVFFKQFKAQGIFAPFFKQKECIK